jgi:hypothetical protein|tara:strand:+ start:154 stop:327 length:174 start_codon:yes stop_codon:yes gene_type:complete
MPLQFVIVAITAILFVVYVVAMSASTRIENRNDALIESTQTEIYAWESVALWMCPLH